MWLIIGTALSLSLGWGIRGNFGHEYGAMIPGALATLAAVLLSGRSDWMPRVAAFGVFGALGWSFGGSISYMQVIAYTHSGHSQTVLYGFACLFVIGFLWAAMGGAGAALPACLDRDSLEEFVAPLSAVFAAWAVQDLVVRQFEPADSQFRQASVLYWYDTDWLAALVAIGAVLLLAAVRRRIDKASSMILHMAAGWWVGFLVLVVVLGWRMTPPRGDNWAGCVGMVAGLWVFLHHQRWTNVTLASLVSGFVGGFGFASATLLKLCEIRSGWQTNWHSVLEQTYGLINGLGLGLAFVILARRAPALPNKPLSRSTQLYAAVFVLVLAPYVNLAKNPAVWIKSKAVPESLYGVSTQTWFNLAWLVLACSAVVVLCRHQRRRLEIVPQSALGKGQMLYLAFLWCMVLGNFERALVEFAPQRIITEGVIHLNAALCTLLVVLLPRGRWPQQIGELSPSGWSVKRIVAVGVAGLLVSVPLDWAVVRALYGDQFAGHAALHIRFGPHATASTAPPSPGKPHP